MVNLLAGIPSVIYGLFGMTLIVPFMRDYVSNNGVGYGIASASVVLAIMILPTIVSVAYGALRSVDTAYYENASALGATKEQATFKVVLPAAKSGIFAGIVLSIGRALGETMAVIMVIGGSPEMPKSIFQSVRNDRQYRDGRNGTFGRRVERAYRNGRGTLCFHLNAQYKFFPA